MLTPADFSIRVNHSNHTVHCLPDTPLLWILRDHLHLTGVKYGCGIGQCGNCMVLLNQQAQRSCQINVSQLNPGDEILTIEAIQDNVMELLRNEWVQFNVPQCAYCQGAMLIKAWDYMTRFPVYEEATLLEQFNNMLCRCGTYNRIKSAIQSAFEKRSQP
jgi:aerobic-type carbon monoxide dehydrogenase small subunit (CoxS/CutS family)